MLLWDEYCYRQLRHQSRKGLAEVLIIRELIRETSRRPSQSALTVSLIMLTRRRVV